MKKHLLSFALLICFAAPNALGQIHGSNAGLTSAPAFLQAVTQCTITVAPIPDKPAQDAAFAACMTQAGYRVQGNGVVPIGPGPSDTLTPIGPGPTDALSPIGPGPSDV